jgi:DNA-binding transcriptional ArsR family regulator
LTHLSFSENDGEQEFRRLLWFLLGTSRGGPNRIRILSAVRERPCNPNQLAKLIGVDYRSIQHHISILLKNSLIIGTGKRYGMVYSIHPWFERHLGAFDEICEKLGFQSYGAVNVSRLDGHAIEPIVSRKLLAPIPVPSAPKL